jgi:type II secretory pathway component GspD/PulD (secretin)
MIATIFGQPSLVTQREFVNIIRPMAPAAQKLPDGIVSCLAIDSLSCLMVQGSSSAIKEFEALVKIYDVTPKQVEIRAKLLTIATNEMNGLGIKWSNTIATAQSPPLSSPAFSFNTAGINAGLTKTLSNNKEVISQMIVTQSGLPASLAFSQDYPVWSNGAIFLTDNAIVYQKPNVSLMSILTKLDVLPRVVGDKIIVTLIPEVSDVVGYVQLNNQNVPIVSRFTMNTTVTLANGSSLAIGGLTRFNNQKTSWFRETKEGTETILILSAEILKP